MSFVRSDALEKIRRRLAHPVIDGDGHPIEYRRQAPQLRAFTRDNVALSMTGTDPDFFAGTALEDGARG